ncbi:MAG: NUDIX hydrolase [Acutalibacteraceae bacterium]|jgi:8-oxo-dGTP diphosphatase
MEKWDLLDDRGRPTGRTMMRGERLTFGQYHLVVHIWVLNAAGGILIQRRAAHLHLMPNMWAATGGSAVSGEDSETAARRELLEELGLNTQPGELTLLRRLKRRNSFCDLWILRREVRVDRDVQLQSEEVAEARWVSPALLREMIRQNDFHNYGKEYFDTLSEVVKGL